MNAPRTERPTFLPHGNAGEGVPAERETRARPFGPASGSRG